MGSTVRSVSMSREHCEEGEHMWGAFEEDEHGWGELEVSMVCMWGEHSGEGRT